MPIFVNNTWCYDIMNCQKNGTFTTTGAVVIWEQRLLISEDCFKGSKQQTPQHCEITIILMLCIHGILPKWGETAFRYFVLLLLLLLSFRHSKGMNDFITFLPIKNWKSLHQRPSFTLLTVFSLMAYNERHIRYKQRELGSVKGFKKRLVHHWRKYKP